MGKRRAAASPTSSPTRSRGISLLRPFDHLWVELILESTDPKKKFSVRDPKGDVLFYGGERLENFTGRGRGRRFHMCLLTPDLMEVLNIYRKEVAIWMGCFCNATCMEQLKVTSLGSRERLLGSVDQELKWSPGVLLNLRNTKGAVELRLRGPKSNFTCCGLWDTKFDILDANSKVVGHIKQETSTVFAHNFNLAFPVALDDKIKAILLSVCFMIACRTNDIRNDGYALTSTLIPTVLEEPITEQPTQPTLGTGTEVA